MAAAPPPSISATLLPAREGPGLLEPVAGVDRGCDPVTEIRGRGWIAVREKAAPIRPFLRKSDLAGGSPCVRERGLQVPNVRMAGGLHVAHDAHDRQVRSRERAAGHDETQVRKGDVCLVDRERTFIGSMNFDARSGNINSEMGVVIESRGLVEALAQLIERDMLPANSWRVTLDAAGDVRWTNDKEVVTGRPACNWRRRVEDVFFISTPKELD